MSGHGASTGLKLILAAVIVIAILGAAFWAGSRALKKNKDATPTPSASATYSDGYTNPPTASSYPTSGGNSGHVGNRVGDIAPDFRLADGSGRSYQLRDYAGRERITLTFRNQHEVLFHPESISEVTLLDPKSSVYFLYNVTSMPYAVTIDANGVITSSGSIR